MSETKMVRASVTIKGKVQGVFFRVHAQEKARRLRLMGWVGNNADGTVSVVAEGPENLVNELIHWCHSGPSTAEVEQVEVSQEPYSAEFNEFEIRY